MEGRGMSQTTPSYLTNRDLFSNHYLTKHLPETEVWETTDEDELRRVYEEIEDLYNRRKDAVSGYNESMLEQRFIRPIFDILDIDYGVEETVKNTRRRPDYGFFKTDEAVDEAFQRTNAGGDFYEDAIGVADAKKWGQSLDTQGDDRHTVENPSFQISVYLDETSADWAVLTNGEQWRIYYAKTAHRLDSYYEVDLPTLLDVCDPDSENGLEPFKHFYHFFRRRAFTETDRECFLNRVLKESNIFAQELGEDLKVNIYDAIEVLADGFLQYDENDLDEDDIDQIHDASLIYLYRLIFVLYAESEGRNLLDTTNRYYRERYSLNTLKQDIAEKREDASYTYPSWEDDLWERLNDLFELIDTGSEAKGIPEDELHIPAYNGGLFRTEPGEDDPREAHFLQENKVSDRHLAEVIDLLTRSEAGANGDGLTFVDYSSLGIRHLGSIYEGLLEYQLNVAEKPLCVEDSEYVPAYDGEEPVVEEGGVYLTTDAGERKATGSYYTPDYIVEYIVQNTLDPHLTEIRNDLLGEHHQFAEQFANRVFELKILDPAMGSGHFLTEVIDYLAREIIDAQQRQAEQQDDPDIDPSRDINWARRQVAQKCIYGVDINPMAVELAKVSLWLRTLAAEQPLAFLDHHLKTGNSLVGSDIEAIEELDTDLNKGGENQSTLAEYGAVRKGTIEQLMQVYQEFISIENRDRADVKEMERKYRQIEQNKLRKRLISIANVHTAEKYDIDVPGGAYERMARAIDEDDEWERLTNERWFQRAQEIAETENFLHWKLQFPEVFYDEEGNTVTDSGFDVIVGNPPYGDIPSGDVEKMQGKGVSDLYAQFLHLTPTILRDGGQFSFIAPTSWETGPAYDEERKLLLQEGRLRLLLNLPYDVFDDAYVDTAIFVWEKGATPQTCSVGDLSGTRVDPQEAIEIVEYTDIEVDTWDELGFVVTDNVWIRLASNIDESFRNLGELTASTRGVLVTDEALDADGDTPIQLDSYQRYEPVSSDAKADWDHLKETPPTKEMFEGQRMLIRRLVSRDDRLMVTTADDDFASKKDVYLFKSEEYDENALLAILNSTLISWWHFRTELAASKDDYRQVTLSALRELPIPSREMLTSSVESLPSDLRHDAKSIVSHRSDIESLLGALADELQERVGKRGEINTNLLDYLGNYTEGEEITNQGFYTPISEPDSILHATTEEFDGLRIGTAQTERDGNDVTISVTARYKPEDEEGHDTDSRGYTETDPIPAFRLTELDESEADLVEAFVPVAVDEDGGFAGFRSNAAKTITLIDRLESITLPKLSDVQGGIDRYWTAVDRDQKLKTEIEQIETLIDRIVYEIYDLDEQDVETIESSFGNPESGLHG